MIFNRHPKFQIEHSGRGGHILCSHKKLTCKFNIEMAEGGNFIVFTGSDSKYDEVRIELRKYLDSSDKKNWWISQ